MLRWVRREWPFVAALIAGLVFWFLALDGTLASFIPQIQSGAHNAAVKGTQGSPLADFRDWITKDAISFFTAILAVFTGALVWVALLEIEYLKRADKTSRRLIKISKKQMLISGMQTDILDKQREIQRQEFLATHRATLEVRFVREVAGGIEITVINTGTGTATFVAARAGIWHLLAGERFPSPHDLLEGNGFSLRSTFGPSESDRCTIVGRGDEFAEGFGSPAHIFGWIIYDTVAPTPVRRTTYFGRRTEILEPELLPVEGSDWNFIQ